jgi:hypothetical protein
MLFTAVAALMNKDEFRFSGFCSGFDTRRLRPPWRDFAYSLFNRGEKFVLLKPL